MERIMKVVILYYTTYGHIHQMALAVAEGVNEIEGMEAILRRVPETLPEEVLIKMGALEAQKNFSDIPEAKIEDLESADAVIFGFPTRFGMVPAQMKEFLDSTGSLWVKGALVGKIGSVFTSSATQHGGQETTILGFIPFMLHHGMLVSGLPYTFASQGTLHEISGGSPYGASTIAGQSGERLPSENELAGARFQGKHVARITKKLRS